MVALASHFYGEAGILMGPANAGQGSAIKRA